MENGEPPRRRRPRARARPDRPRTTSAPSPTSVYSPETRRRGAKTKRNRRRRGRPYGVWLALAGCFLLIFLTARGCRKTVVAPPPTPTHVAPSELPADLVEPPKLAANSLENVIVILDPGHGGSDCGANYGDLTEATATYRLTATLAQVCRDAGADVRFTVVCPELGPVPLAGPEIQMVPPDTATAAADPRMLLRSGRDDVEMLYIRAKVASQVVRSLPRDSKTRVVFLAIHFDAARKGIRGGWVLYDPRVPGPPSLAKNIARALSDSGLARSRPREPNPRELGVLNPLRNPVRERVLVEVATLSDAADRADMKNPAWRRFASRVLADAIAKTVADKP